MSSPVRAKWSCHSAKSSINMYSLSLGRSFVHDVQASHIVGWDYRPLHDTNRVFNLLHKKSVWNCYPRRRRINALLSTKMLIPRKNTPVNKSQNNRYSRITRFQNCTSAQPVIVIGHMSVLSGLMQLLLFHEACFSNRPTTNQVLFEQSPLNCPFGNINSLIVVTNHTQKNDSLESNASNTCHTVRWALWSGEIIWPFFFEDSPVRSKLLSK